MVSTDNDEIANIAASYGAEVPFIRPAYLARDETPSIDVILHVLNFYELKKINYDIVALLEPTSPLRKKGDLETAIRNLILHYDYYDGIISLGKIQLENPFIAKIVKDDNIQPLLESSEIIQNRQKYPNIYFPYGVIYAVKKEILKKTKSFYKGKMLPFFIERWQNYEIDDLYDFMCVETIFKHKLMEIVQ